MLDWVPSAPYTAEQLLEVLRILRDPENGCPWDKVQTHASIRKNFLEETCEALEAIDADDAAMMREFLQTLRSGRGSKTSADASVESHLIALAAEESRLRGGEAIDMNEWRTNE